MKKLMPLIVLFTLTTLASCGRSSKPEINSKESSQQQMSLEKSDQFIFPTIGIHRSVTMDPSIKSVYENLTVKPKKDSLVLGDSPFYIMVNEQGHSLTEYTLGFYADVKVKNIYSFENKMNLQLMDLAHLKTLPLNNVQDFVREDLVWGKRNLNQPEMDMLNKGHVIITEAMDQRSGKEFTANSTYLVWFECSEGLQNLNETGYTCGKFGLKFHYKLLDYQLKERKI